MYHEQRRQPQRQRADDGEILRLILESATDCAIFTMDPNGIATSWNAGADRLLGYKENEILGRSADVMFPPEEGGADAAVRERQTARAHGRAEKERWQMRKDGTRLWVSGLLMPLSDPKLGFLKILRDRTPQHRAEELLRESEELFRVLATNIPQLVFRTKVGGSRTWGSPQWTIFTGLPLAESVEFGWMDSIHPEDREPTQAAWAGAPARGEYYVEHRVRSARGDYRWHQTRARPLSSHDDEWVGTMTDVHDLRMLQEQQKVLLAELQHRTRNLLAVIQSIAQRTIRSSGSLKEFMEKFENRLRTLSRVQGLLARTDHQPIDMHELVDSELSAHLDGSDAQEKVSVHGPPASLPPNSAQSLALALHELATNAAKYGALSQPAGKLVVRWSVREDSGDPHLLLEWRESGVTIPETPTRKGFGTELIERALPYQLGARTKLEFAADGVRCEISAPIKSGIGANG